MAFSDSNYGQLLYIDERGLYNSTGTAGQLRTLNPTTTRKAKTLRLTSSDFSVSKNTIVSDEVRADRMVSAISEVGTTSTGTVNYELSLGGTFDDLIEAALCGNWTNEAYMLSAAGAKNPTSVTVGAQASGFVSEADEFRNIAIGQWIYTKFATTTALNGWYRVTSQIDSQGNVRSATPGLVLIDEASEVKPVRNIHGLSLVIDGGLSANGDVYAVTISNGTKNAVYTYTATTATSATSIISDIATAIQNNATYGKVVKSNTTASALDTGTGYDIYTAQDVSASSPTGSTTALNGSIFLVGPATGANLTVTVTATDAGLNDAFVTTENTTGVAGTGHTLTFEVQGSFVGSNVYTSTSAFTDWTESSSNWNITSNRYVHTAGDTADLTYNVQNLTDGKWYSAVVDIYSISGGSLAMSSGTDQPTLGTTSTIDTAGKHVLMFRAVGNEATIKFTPTTNAVCHITSLVVNEGDYLMLELAPNFNGTSKAFYAGAGSSSTVAAASILAACINASSSYTASASASRVIVENATADYVTQVTGIEASATNIVNLVTDPQPSKVLAAGESFTISGKMLRNGIMKRSFVVEQGFTDVSKYFRFNGQRLGTMSLDLASGAVINGSFGFQGASAEQGDTSFADSTTTDVTTTTSTVNATENVGDIRESSAMDILANTVQSFSLNVDNALRDQSAVGEKYPKGIGYGRQTVSGSMTVYFENGNLYDKFLNHTYTQLSIDAFDGAATPNRIRITLPRVIFQTDNPNVGGIDQDVTESIDFTAIYDPTTRCQIQIDLAAQGALISGEHPKRCSPF